MTKKRTAVSSTSTTNPSTKNKFASHCASLQEAIAQAKNTLIGRISCALILLAAMWSVDGVGTIDGLQYGMLYMMAENAKKSGRADGNVYMRNGRIRGMAIPSNPNTAYQSAQRGNLGTLSSGWNSLTPAQQAAWNAFQIQDTDRFGREVFISGKGAYVALNRNLYNVSEAALSDPPLQVGTPSVSSLTLTADTAPADVLSLAFAPTPVGANYAYLVYATAGQTAGTFAPSASKYRLISYLATGAATPADILAAWNTRFGTLTAGTKVFVKVTVIGTNTGIASAAVTTSAIVL